MDNSATTAAREEPIYVMEIHLATFAEYQARVERGKSWERMYRGLSRDERTPSRLVRTYDQWRMENPESNTPLKAVGILFSETKQFYNKWWAESGRLPTPSAAVRILLNRAERAIVRWDNGGVRLRTPLEAVKIWERQNPRAVVTMGGRFGGSQIVHIEGPQHVIDSVIAARFVKRNVDLSPASGRPAFIPAYGGGTCGR